MKDSVIDKLKKKCRWFDIIEITGYSTPVEFKNGLLYSVKEKQNSGTGVRVNSDGKTGFSFTNGRSLDETASTALEMARFGDEEKFELPHADEVYPECAGFSGDAFDIQTEIEKGRQLAGIIKEKYPQAETDISITGSQGTRKLLNSNNLSLEENFTCFSASASVTLAEPDGRTEVWSSFSADGSGPLELLERELLWRLDESRKSAKVQSKKMPVLLTPQAVMAFLDIIISGLNARPFYKGISPFCDKIGTQLFNRVLNIVDNPLMKESPYRFAFDDEGVPAKRKYLVKNGVPETVITDLKYSWLLDRPVTGNGSRGYSSLPSPSFSLIEIEPGKETFSEIRSNVSDGIVVDSLIGLGQSNTVTGDFSANVDMGFLIKNGEMCGRVKDCMISGNVFSMLSGNIGIASDPFFAGGSRVPGILVENVDVTSH